MRIIDIVVDYNNAIVNGIVIPKPKHVSSVFWTTFWDIVVDCEEDFCNQREQEHELENARVEIEDLKDRIKYLEEYVARLEAEEPEDK
jgi:uncharacterized small protein (DUF1192 family)